MSILLQLNGWTVSLTLPARLSAWPTQQGDKVPDKKEWFAFTRGRVYEGPHEVQVGSVTELIYLLEELAGKDVKPSPAAKPVASVIPVVDVRDLKPTEPDTPSRPWYNPRRS